MNTKPKLILCASILALGTSLSLFLSTIMHYAMSMQKIILPSFSACLGSLMNDKRHFSLFMCLVGLSLLLSLSFFFTNRRAYQSDLNVITPEIKTPAAAGQYQHGSARWLTAKEMDKAFPSFCLDPRDNQIVKLLKGGNLDGHK